MLTVIENDCMRRTRECFDKLCGFWVVLLDDGRAVDERRVFRRMVNELEAMYIKDELAFPPADVFNRNDPVVESSFR